MSEEQIRAGAGNTSAYGDHGALQLGPSELSELLALWGQCPRAFCFGWLSSTEQHHEHPSSLGVAAHYSPSVFEHLHCFCSLSSGHQHLKHCEALGCPSPSAWLCCSGCFRGITRSQQTLTHGQQVEDKPAVLLGETTMDKVAPSVAEVGWH